MLVPLLLCPVPSYPLPALFCSALQVSLCMDLDCDVCLINLAGKMATHSALPQALDLLDCIRGPGVRVGVRKSSPLGTILNGSMSSGTE